LDGKPIGVFDSGVGGLTVAGEIMKQLPDESLLYFGDTARFPYGSRGADELKRFAFEIVSFLQCEGVKMVVIACNSASSAALTLAQAHFDIPILGVIEPGARAAVQATRNRRIGVVGTQATISSGAYDRAIHTLDAGAKVFSQACPDLADFVERGVVTGEKARRIVGRYLESLISAGVDTLILGCTHYPLLSEVIGEIMGKDVRLVSSAEEAAREVREILTCRGHLRKEKSSPTYRFLSTGDESKFLRLGRRFLGREIKRVEKVSLGTEVAL